MFLSQGYDTGSGGWVDKEGEKLFRLTEGDAVDEALAQSINNREAPLEIGFAR